MKHTIYNSTILLVVSALLVGLIYPLLITGISQLIFPANANGSLMTVNDTLVGSALIGQNFTQQGYFEGRPVGTSNLGQSSKELQELIKARTQHFARHNQLEATSSIPTEMVHASGSGIDPHISPQAAIAQLKRIVLERQLTDAQENQLIELIKTNTEQRTWGFMGNPRINVLLLNLELDTTFGHANSNKQ